MVEKDLVGKQDPVPRNKNQNNQFIQNLREIRLIPPFVQVLSIIVVMILSYYLISTTSTRIQNAVVTMVVRPEIALSILILMTFLLLLLILKFSLGSSQDLTTRVNDSSAQERKLSEELNRQMEEVRTKMLAQLQAMEQMRNARAEAESRNRIISQQLEDKYRAFKDALDRQERHHSKQLEYEHQKQMQAIQYQPPAPQKVEGLLPRFGKWLFG